MINDVYSHEVTSLLQFRSSIPSIPGGLLTNHKCQSSSARKSLLGHLLQLSHVTDFLCIDVFL